MLHPEHVLGQDPVASIYFSPLIFSVQGATGCSSEFSQSQKVSDTSTATEQNISTPPYRYSKETQTKLRLFNRTLYQNAERQEY